MIDERKNFIIQKFKHRTQAQSTQKESTRKKFCFVENLKNTRKKNSKQLNMNKGENAIKSIASELHNSEEKSGKNSNSNYY